MNFKITIAYDGTDFTGWQMQPGAQTIQGALTEALTSLDGAPVTVFGAGRTDSGVHAEGQVASFVLTRIRSATQIRHALNGMLPRDIRVLEAAAAPDNFHARRDAQSKTYRYHLFTARAMNPFLNRFAWHFPYSLNLERLRQDAALLVGTHDFSAFTVVASDVKTRIRTLTAVEVGSEGTNLLLRFTGNGFLRYMVRTMVSALVDVNRGRLRCDSLEELLKTGDRHLAGAMAPAKGLTMMKVEY
ncbi:MAG: tRNA pseudouridine(38-40) synthase TruA [Acidobacteriota bacterium]